jgi:hypothetical protein
VDSRRGFTLRSREDSTGGEDSTARHRNATSYMKDIEAAVLETCGTCEEGQPPYYTKVVTAFGKSLGREGLRRRRSMNAFAQCDERLRRGSYKGSQEGHRTSSCKGLIFIELSIEEGHQIRVLGDLTLFGALGPVAARCQPIRLNSTLSARLLLIRRSAADFESEAQRISRTTIEQFGDLDSTWTRAAACWNRS